MKAVCLGLLVVAWCGAPEDVAWWEATFGPADVTAISGNGRLTAGVNRYGRLSSCRWPSPGYHDQLRYQTVSRDQPALGVLPWHGAMWAIRIGSKLYWLTGEPWQATQTCRGETSTVIETSCTLPDTGVTVAQSLFVHPLLDVLVARIAVLGADSAPSVYWFQNFTPCTRLIPEVPVADWMLDRLNDFAAFAALDGQTLYHCRPPAPSAEDWSRAERLASKGAQPVEWAVFDDEESGKGVWIATASPNPVAALQCGVDGSPAAPWAEIERGRLSGTRGATGSCQTALELAPQGEEQTFCATVFIAFGHGFEQVNTALDQALEWGCERLRADTEAYWNHWLAQAGLSLQGNAWETVRRRALLTIAQSTDRESGAVVRAPITQPPLAFASARAGAWVTLALDMAGYTALAGKHAQFYAGALRRQSRRGMPAGSLAAALYTNGIEAAPHPVLEVDAAAWMLSGLWRHARFLDEVERIVYLEPAWESVEAATDFLAGWTDGRSGAPYASFQSGQLCDGRSGSLLLGVLMGLESGRHIARALERTPNPDWVQRQRELDVLIRTQIINDGTPWTIEPTFPYWLAGILEDRPENESLWRVRVETGNGPMPMGEVLFPVDVLLDSPREEPVFPDTTRAALHFIAATLRLYGQTADSCFYAVAK